MNKYEIIDKLFRDETIQTICKNIVKDSKSKWTEDLIGEVNLILLEYEDDKIVEAFNNNQINFLITRIVMNQFRSASSSFYRKYKRYNENFTSLNYTHENIIESPYE